jgi:hypothetical protein
MIIDAANEVGESIYKILVRIPRTGTRTMQPLHEHVAVAATDEATALHKVEKLGYRQEPRTSISRIDAYGLQFVGRVVR